jgi:hypothetical protein
MINADLSVTIPHQAAAQYLPAIAHCNPIDTAARGIVQPIILHQRPALQIADGYARVWQGSGQDVETNINAMRKLRASW